MNDGRWAITFGAFISMSLLGMSRTFLGTALPAIRSSLDLSILQAGTLPVLLQLGFSIAVFFGGPLSDIFKKRSILVIGCLLMGVSFIFFAHLNSFWISLLWIILIGIGGGLIESSSNPLLIQLYPGRELRMMNFHHFFFAAGSLIGPLVMGLLLSNSIPWQWGYTGFGFFVLIIFLFLLSQKVDSVKSGGSFDLNVMRKFIGERVFIFLFFTTFFAIGVQNGVSYWMVTFLKEFRNLSIALASTSLFLFFACIAIGRLSSGYLIPKFKEPAYLISLFLLLSIMLPIAVLVPGRWAIPFFAICGLAHSGIFPCLLGMTGKLYSVKTGTALGIIATGAGLGSAAVPWLMSLVSQITTLQTGFLSFEIFVIICLFLLIVNFKNLKIRFWN
jgi:FHS family glucose/mannose:H+ symporter-like MFS transporter